MSNELPLLRLPLDDINQVIEAVGYRWERLRGQRLLLTGGTGFIGKWLLGSFLYANRRLRLDAKVVVLSRQPEVFLAEYPELRDATDLEWLKGDVRDFALKYGAPFTFAIHAATDVVASSSPLDVLDTCVAGTRRVLDVLTMENAPVRMLLLSSGAVYGRPPPESMTIPEEWQGGPDPLIPSSAYGEGKRVSELLCTMAAKARPEFEVSIARCFAFVGPHIPLDKHFAIGNFIGAALMGEDIRIQGDGTALRSYLYAADLAHWLWVMLFDAPSGRAFNVGGEEVVSIEELAYRVNRVLQGSGGVQVAQVPCPGTQPLAYVPEVTRISTELGLCPAIGLDEAIRRTARWAARSRGLT